MARPHARAGSRVAEKKKWRTPSVTERRHSDTSDPFSRTNTPALAHTPKPAFPPPQNSEPGCVGSRTGARLAPTSPDVPVRGPGSVPPACTALCLPHPLLHTHTQHPTCMDEQPPRPFPHAHVCARPLLAHTHASLHTPRPSPAPPWLRNTLLPHVPRTHHSVLTHTQAHTPKQPHTHPPFPCNTHLSVPAFPDVSGGADTVS